jgi:hypothetical protein
VVVGCLWVFLSFPEGVLNLGEFVKDHLKVVVQKVAKMKRVGAGEKHFPQRNEPSFVGLRVAQVEEEDMQVELLECVDAVHEQLGLLYLQHVHLHREHLQVYVLVDLV